MGKSDVLESLRSQNRAIGAVMRILRDMQKRNEKIIGEVNRGELSIEDSGAGLPVKEVAERVISYLNGLTDRTFEPGALNTLELIRNLLEQGRSVEDMLLVIDAKCREWDGTEFQQFLRPQTLFGKNFESYLVEAQINASKYLRPGRKPIEGLQQLHRMKMQQYQNEANEQKEALGHE